MKVRIKVDLPLGSIEILRQLAISQGISLTEAMRRAVATEGLLQRKIKQGSRVLLESVDGCVNELVFR